MPLLIPLAAIAAIGVILVGLFTKTPFLLWVGGILFFVGFVGFDLLTEGFFIPLVVVLVILIMLLGKKK